MGWKLKELQNAVQPCWLSQELLPRLLLVELNSHTLCPTPMLLLSLGKQELHYFFTQLPLNFDRRLGSLLLPCRQEIEPPVVITSQIVIIQIDSQLLLNKDGLRNKK